MNSPPRGAGDPVSPRPAGTAAATAAPEEDQEARSLLEDLETLIDDGRTYLEAEANYQRTRAIYVADRLQSAALFGTIAALFGFIALIGLTVGLIIALSPYLTVWGSSALVVGLEAFAALYFARKAAKRWHGILAALGKEDDR